MNTYSVWPSRPNNLVPLSSVDTEKISFRTDMNDMYIPGYAEMFDKLILSKFLSFTV